MTALPIVDYGALPRAAKPRVSVAPRFHAGLLLQFALCLAPMPPAFLIGRSAPVLGQFAFFSGFALLLAYHTIQRRSYHVLTLIISALPLLMILRGIHIPYNSVLALLLFGFAFALVAPGEFSRLWKRKTVLCVLIGATIYWWISFLLTEDYSRNLRTVDWALSVALVLMLSERRSYLRTALLGWGISAAVGGLMLLPYGDRLGLAVIDGIQMGNPVLLGVPCAFVLLLTIAESGNWILPQTPIVWRVLVGCACGILLVFSTSRGSWLIAIVGLLVLFACDRRSRTPIVVLGAMLGIALMVLANSSHVQSANHYLMKVISPDTSLTVKTTGRIDQWLAFPTAFWDSPVWGFGPGMSRKVSLTYSGENLIFHSLFLQIGAELGLIGLAGLALLLGIVIRSGIAHFRRFGEIVPLIGIISFIIMGLSVTAFDPLGGTLLGMGLLAGDRSNLRRLKTQFTSRQRSSRFDPIVPGIVPLDFHEWPGML